MIDPNLKLLEEAATVLRPVLDEFVFLGGCATGLLVTDPAVAGVRSTMDVDVITEVSSYGEYHDLADRLRQLGLTEDSREDAPICRWRFGDLTIDVMPTSEEILGFSNRWYGPAISSAQEVEVGAVSIKLVTPVYFLATKLEAFLGRGNNDFGGSRDLEDLVAVVDGRSTVVADVQAASSDVRLYIGSEVRQLLGVEEFTDGLAGLLLPDAGSQARRAILVDRLESLAAMASR